MTASRSQCSNKAFSCRRYAKCLYMHTVSVQPGPTTQRQSLLYCIVYYSFYNDRSIFNLLPSFLVIPARASMAYGKALLLLGFARSLMSFGAVVVFTSLKDFDGVVSKSMRLSSHRDPIPEREFTLFPRSSGDLSSWIPGKRGPDSNNMIINNPAVGKRHLKVYPTPELGSDV